MALEISLNELSKWEKTIVKYESDFLNTLKKLNINFIINGENRLPGILNITFKDILSQDLIIALDMNGYAISGGSACSSGLMTAPKSLIEIGLNQNLANRTVRISFGKNILKNNVTDLSKCIAKIINNVNK